MGKGESCMTIKGHSGKASITITSEEYDVLLAELYNHRTQIQAEVDKERARVNLIQEERKK